MYGRAKVPVNLWIFVCLTLVAIFLISPNILLAIPVMLYIPFIYRLFFIKGNTNILFWGLLFQWVTISIQLIYCSILGIPLNSLFLNTVFPSELLEYTELLSIIAMYFFSLGVFLAVKRLKVPISEKMWEQYDPKKIMQAYIVASLIISSSQLAIWAFPGLVQYFFFFFYIKWGFLLITFISIFKRAPELKIFMYVIIIVEFILGLSSFFANNFVNILVFSIIAYASVNRKITYYHGIFIAIMGGLLFHVAVLWTASKKDYRAYLTQSTGSQTVAVSREVARKKLLELVVKIDSKTYNDAIEDMVNRIGYIQYFAAAIRYVPDRIPFEDGKVYLAAISHYLVPRFINPDKPILDDSKHTNKYTGLGVSDRRRATSFSLGSYADAYIDFGPVFMYIPIFLFGFLIGSFFRYLYRPNLWGIVFTGPFFLLINVYGADTTKALGFVLIYFLVMAILHKHIVKTVDPLLRPTNIH